jgi:hypothetical protein
LRLAIGTTRVRFYTCRVNHEQASRLVAESHRLLTEGRARIERQRAIIARLEQLGVDSAKQQTFLARLVEEQDQLAQRAVETLDWLQANPSPSAPPLVTPPNRGSDT